MNLIRTRMPRTDVGGEKSSDYAGAVTGPRLNAVLQSSSQNSEISPEIRE